MSGPTRLPLAFDASDARQLGEENTGTRDAFMVVNRPRGVLFAREVEQDVVWRRRFQ